jgi:LPS-assembly protein
MPFDSRAALTLTLAIVAATFTQPAQAEASDERLWSCNLTPTGEWDCVVDETLLEEQEGRVAAGQTAPESGNKAEPTNTERTTSETAAEAVASERGTGKATATDTESIGISAAPPAPTTELRTGAPAAIRWPEPAAALARPPTAAPSAQAATTPASGDWNCVATDGEWACSRENTPAPAAADRAVVQSPKAVGGKPEWNCEAVGGEWQCQQVATRAPARLDTPGRHVATPAAAAALDWYPYPAGEAPGACTGRYIEPEFAFLEDERPLDQQPVFVNALTSSTRLGGLTRLEGGVEIQRGGRLFTSASGEYDQKTRIARLLGGVTYREKGLLLLGDQAEANMISGDTRFSGARYVMHQEHMRGSADSITRFGDRRILLTEGAISYCEPGSNAWQIAADSIELNPDTGRGVARHATFDVAGIPLLYTPYFSFPIDDRRQSGFLFPGFGYSDSDGVDISLPYYFNLAENYDDTLTPRYIGERGLLLENEFRYMNRHSTNTLSTAWLSDDDLYGESRWLFGIEHGGNLYDNLFSRIDFTRVSDDSYFEDLGTSLEVQRNDHLNQLFELRYLQPDWNLTLRTEGYQTIDGTTPYERLPQLLLTGRETRVAGLLDLEYQAEYTRFERDLESRYAPLGELEATVGDRVHIRPRLSFSLDRPWGFIRPALTFWHSSYDLDNERNGALGGSESISATILSLDSGMVLERDFALAQNHYTQTLEPRLFLLHADADEQPDALIPRFDSSQLGFTYYNLFHETGWSGNDRVADTTQATVGVSTALYNELGAEKLRVGVAQAQYFADREYAGRPGDDPTGSNAGSSNLATLARWSITPNLQLSHDGEVDRDSYNFLEQNYKLSYLPGDERLFYLSYRDNTEKDLYEGIQQVDLAFRWPLNNRWTSYGRWQQDLDNEENLETLFGLEYSTCCWKVRLTGRRWVVDPNTVAQNQFETDTGFYLQFVFRGLGAFGQGGGREFLEDITGYNEDDNGSF